MEDTQEAVEVTETQELTNDPAVNQAIAFLEATVEENIGVASDGKP
jgi:hypothetical protein